MMFGTNDFIISTSQYHVYTKRNTVNSRYNRLQRSGFWSDYSIIIVKFDEVISSGLRYNESLL